MAAAVWMDIVVDGTSVGQVEAAAVVVGTSAAVNGDVAAVAPVFLKVGWPTHLIDHFSPWQTRGLLQIPTSQSAVHLQLLT